MPVTSIRTSPWISPVGVDNRTRRLSPCPATISRTRRAVLSYRAGLSPAPTTQPSAPLRQLFAIPLAPAPTSSVKVALGRRRFPSFSGSTRNWAASTRPGQGGSKRGAQHINPDKRITDRLVLVIRADKPPAALTLDQRPARSIRFEGEAITSDPPVTRIHQPRPIRSFAGQFLSVAEPHLHPYYPTARPQQGSRQLHTIRGKNQR